MKKIFAIFILSTLSFVLGAFVLAQDNNPANTQGIQDLLQRVQNDSTCVAESTETRDNLTGQSNSNICAPVNKNDGIYFTPNVDIPGFFEGTQQITPNTIGLYINAVYKYGAGLAGVLAMFMIVFAAWQWIIAAGNSGKIENAKDTIISALIGLALLFGGYLLLSQISYRLVEMKSLDITPIVVRQIQANSRQSDSCINFNETTCGAMSQLGLCEWIISPNGANYCLEKQGGLVPGESWEIVSQIYEQNLSSRLICCGANNVLLPDDWQIGLVGGTNRNCNAVFNNQTSRQYEFSTNSCLSLKCEDHNWSRSNCEELSFCYWDTEGIDDCKIK